MALRYQLFHRVAAAVREAKRYACHHAFLLVQSFSTHLTGHSDFSAFTSAIGLGSGPPRTVVGLKEFDGVSLSAGWLPVLPTVSATTPAAATIVPS